MKRQSRDFEGEEGGLGVFGNPKESWSAFKTTIFDVADGFLGTPVQANNFVS